MKRAGVVRRIDDLSCIVIQNETRKVLKIHEEDPIHPHWNLYIFLK